MGRTHRTTLFVFAALILGLGIPTAAQAELKFCNKTKGQVNVAVGYKVGEDWTSEGWWTIEPGSCKVPVGGVLKNRYYYYYADSDSKVWDGDFIFCTQDTKFTIQSDKDCKSRGYAPEGFRELDIGEATSKEIDLTDN